MINVAGNSGSQSDIDPVGTDYDRTTTHQAEQILLPNHPYITGQGYPGNALSVSDFNNWGSTDHGWLTGFSSGDANSVLRNTDGVSWVEYSHGSGTVIVTTLTYGWGSGGAARGNPLRNLIEYSLFLGGGPVGSGPGVAIAPGAGSGSPSGTEAGAAGSDTTAAGPLPQNTDTTDHIQQTTEGADGAIPSNSDTTDSPSQTTGTSGGSDTANDANGAVSPSTDTIGGGTSDGPTDTEQ